ncbi:Zeaxanthin glucosyltransferase [Seminavis robusta]|uniref:Zeaxanthin glucosyltransferase n=1 Tax=Seminavis robusta TaxID=568900 RepID=A0A9N8DF52_9STRA|nr:Zeaxanthin glucosyltransferase [Seminavis robusta]|eukprot:Sro114_g056300.1 Zeaxanthin glucosyltransferase (488) ;mRNA; f:32766-34229
MHIVIIAPPYHGHLTSGASLGGALKKARGHSVTFVASAKGQRYAEREELDFVELVGHDQAMEEGDQRLASLSGIDAVRCTSECLVHYATLLLRDLPGVLDTLEQPVDAILLDEILYLAATSVAEYKKIPFGVHATTVSVSHSTDVPPFTTTWDYRDAWWGRLRDTAGWMALLWQCPISSRPVVNEWRLQHGLPEIPSGMKRDGGVIQVTQQPYFLEFPKKPDTLPSHFFYTTPWHTDTTADVTSESTDDNSSFPFDKLDASKPLIYASLGTVQNQSKQVYQNICQACLELLQEQHELQLVLALGKKGVAVEDIIPPMADNDNNNILVVDFAPQLQLLDRASMVITHCGMNTTLETMARGIPALAIPITNDQPGVAARWRSLGAVMVLDSPAQATTVRIQQAIRALLPEASTYRQAAKTLQRRLQEETPNLDETAHLIELAFSANQEAKEKKEGGSDYNNVPLTTNDSRAKEILKGKQVEPPKRKRIE